MQVNPSEMRFTLRLKILLPFKKSRNTLPQYTVTREFPADDARRPVSTKGLRQVSSARAHGRADEAGPSLARDIEEASAGDE